MPIVLGSRYIEDFISPLNIEIYTHVSTGLVPGRTGGYFPVAPEGIIQFSVMSAGIQSRISKELLN